MAELLRKAGKLPWAKNEEGTENQDCETAELTLSAMRYLSHLII